VKPRPDVEVAVVGAGVMGLATARALARAGRDVVVCEQREVGHSGGSSHGGSRIVRLSYPEERWVRLAQEAYPLWRELEAAWGRALLDQPGTLDLGDWEPNRDALAACGVPFEVLDAAEIERRFPIRMDRGGSGLFQADGGIVYADLALQALLGSATGAGAQVRERTRVDSIDDEGETVSLDGLRAGAVVVTAGAWAPTLVGVDATPTLETTSYFALDEPVPSVIDTSPGDELGYALAAPGSGLKAGLHQSGRHVDPDRPGTPDPEIAERTAAWVERRFPAAGERVHLETCIYTTRPNDEFVLERKGRIVIGSACSGHGFKFAPVVGERLAALAIDALSQTLS
jgi:sarcosine oxidase